MSDPYWTKRQAVLDTIRNRKIRLVTEIIEITKTWADEFHPDHPTDGPQYSGDSFFPSNDDDTLYDALADTGFWRVEPQEGSLWWVAISPAGDELTYQEGDLYGKGIRRNR